MAEDIVARYHLELNQLKADVVELKKQFGLVDKAASESTSKAGSAMDKLGANIKTLGSTLIAAFSIEKIVSFGLASIEAFREAEKSARKLQIAVGVNGGLQADFDNLLQQSKELQQQSIFSESQVQNAQTIALQFGLTSDAVENLIPIITDFASATDQDLGSALQAVILGTEGSARALHKYGIEVDTNATRAQRFASISDQLNAKFKGQAELLLGTSVGAVARLRNNFQTLKESIGEALIPFANSAVSAANALIKLTEVPLSQTLEDERQALALTEIKLQDVNLPTEERIKLIEELKSKYPEYLKNIDAEKISTGELNDALEKVNVSLVNRIVIQRKQEEIDKHAQETADALEKKLSAEERALKFIQQAREKYNFQLQKGLTIQQQAAAATDFLNKNFVKQKGISDDAFGLTQNLASASGDLTQAQLVLGFEVNKGNNLQAERIKLMKDLGIEEEKAAKKKPTGLETLTPEEIDKANALKLKSAEEELQKEVAARKRALAEMHLTEKEEATAITQIDLFELQKRLANSIAYGKNNADQIGQIIGQIADKEIELRKNLSDQELDQDERNLQKEVALRTDAIGKIHLTEKQMSVAVTQIELFELTNRLNNYRDYGKEVQDILVQIASKQLELQKELTDNELDQDEKNLKHFVAIRKTALLDSKMNSDQIAVENTKIELDELEKRRQNYIDYGKDIGDIDDEIANKKIQLKKQIVALDEATNLALLKSINDLSSGFAGVAAQFTQMNLDRINSMKEQNDAAASDEEAKIKFQFDQRIIGQDEYEKKLQAIKNKREGNEKSLNDRMRKLQNRQALFEKANTVFTIGLKTREAIMDIQSKWAAFPPIATGLTIATLVLAAAQLTAALALQPPTAHEGESFVKRKESFTRGLKHDETLRTLQVGERVVDKFKNRDHWGIYEAIEGGSLNDYIYHRWISPALSAHSKAKEANQNKSFAENIATSMIGGSGKDGDSIDPKLLIKMWRGGIRISNLHQLAGLINSSENPYRKI